MSGVVHMCVLMFCVLTLQNESDPKKPLLDADALTIEVKPKPEEGAPSAEPRYTASITGADVATILELDGVPLQLLIEKQRPGTTEMLEKVNMDAVLEVMADFLDQHFAGRFNSETGLLTIPIAASRQLSIETPELDPATYKGPKSEVVGFLLYDITEAEYLSVAARVIHTARRLADSGDPIYDRTTPEYVRWLADRDIAARLALLEAAELEQQEHQEIRKRIAEALGIEADAEYTAQDANWLKESRRFSYIIKEGKFIHRLEPLVERINFEMEVAGFAPPSELDRPGIYYDPEIGDVDIVLPKPMLVAFLEHADTFESRMAESAIISLEAVRLTDREITSGVLASRTMASFQGVHDVQRHPRFRNIYRELGLNSLLAVANQQLQVQTFNDVAAGSFPANVAPVQIAPPTLPPLQVGNDATYVGTTLDVGADNIFFDGRQQSYGFSYVTPDGIVHQLTTDVADSMQEFWSRIERNLIVHKIKKTDSLTEFSVPVGPATKTYKGLAALISQENQQLVVATGTGALSEITATAGTWLVIEDFDITPIPGSSTTLTEEELRAVSAKVLLTMFLRDPYTDPDFKRELLSCPTRQVLYEKLEMHQAEVGSRPIRPGRRAKSYGQVYTHRYEESVGDARFEKREENSVISLNFFSSQGNIVQPQATQLGDNNDLTSFTTVLRPNIVTPISSFLTKTGSGRNEQSALTNRNRGESIDKDKTMTHLLVRARFPTIGRERADREEGRFLGYFNLPSGRDPVSSVDVPFLASSEHPLERLAKLRVGLMFPVLDESKVRKPFARLNPNKFPGDVPRDSWECAMTRFMMNCTILSQSPGADEGNLSDDYVERFVIEVRNLLEYDEDFFDAPHVALRNMSQWNDPNRIVLALNNSPGRFALEQLLDILDRLGEELVPPEYSRDFLAMTPLGTRKIYDLRPEQLQSLRRDVAAHYLRLNEAYGDAFLEAISLIFALGTYDSLEDKVLEQGIFGGYLRFVMFDNSGSQLVEATLYDRAHDDFMLLKAGGYKAPLFKKSLLRIGDLPGKYRRLVYRGTDILELREKPAKTVGW